MTPVFNRYIENADLSDASVVNRQGPPPASKWWWDRHGPLILTSLSGLLLYWF